MGEILVFAAVVLTVVLLVHYYLWRRLVRDTTTTTRWRRAGLWTLVALSALLILTVVGGRMLPHSLAALLSWPGYLWLAVMFYLLITLAVLELPALAGRIVLRRQSARDSERALAGVVASRDEAGAAMSGRTISHKSASDKTAADKTAADKTASGMSASDKTAADMSASGEVASGASAAGSPDGGQSRRVFLARTVAVTAGVVSVGVVASGLRSALRAPQIKRVRVPLAKLPSSADGYRIALVSDIHLGPLRGIAHTQRIVDLINGLDADMVAVVGDLVDGTVAQLREAVRPLRNLRSRHGSFFVTGNHEYYSGYQEWVDEVADLGVRPLRNEWLELPGGLDLSGVNDLSGKSYEDGPDFDKALAGRDPSRPVVLLAHQPIQAHDAAKHGVDLQLSGHTHGGQLVPFNYVVRLAQQPVVSGLGEVDGMPVYVTNGAGFWGPPVRVGAPPDITVVELSKR